MDESGKTREELLLEVERLQLQLAAAERDHQILVAGLREERRLAEAEWRHRLETLEAKQAAVLSRPLEGRDQEDRDSERRRLLVPVQSLMGELETADEERTLQTEELQAANKGLTIQTEELRISNEGLSAQAEILEQQNNKMEHLARDLETERALLTSTLEQMPGSVVIAAAPAGPILLSNSLANQIWDDPLQSSDLEGFWRIPRYHLGGEVYRLEEMPLWRSLNKGEAVTDEEMILRPEGRAPVHLSVSSTPVRDAQGRIVAGVVIHSDITARKEVEGALRESHNRIVDILESISDGFLSCDLDMVVTYFNRAAAKILGRDRSEVLGKPLFDAFPEARGSVFEEKYTEALREGKNLSFETYFETVPYQNWYEVRVFPYGGGISVYFQVTTERKQAEESLKESEERYRNLFDNNHTVMLLIDPKTGAIVDANPTACSYYGYSREEFTAVKISAINTLTPEQVFAEMQKARGREQQQFHFRHRLASGEVRDVEVFSGPIRVRGQDLLYSIVHDITARKQAKEASQRSREELELRVKERTAELRDTVAQLIEEIQERHLAQESLRKQAELLELAQEAIIVRDLDSRVIFWNRGAEETYGWPREQAAGRVIHALLRTRFPISLEEIDQELLQTGGWRGELVHTRADGEEIIVASRMALQRDDDGQPAAILEVNRDVTARRRAEEALETERQRLLSVFERIPASVALLRPDHTFAFVNGEFIRRFGEPGSRRCHELLELESPCEECEAMAVIQTGIPKIREWTGPDGNLYQMYDYPFIDVGGSPLVLEMGVDITARKQADEQVASLGRMYRMLSKVNEAIVRVSSKDELFRQICRIMMEEGDFLLAWIGLADPGTRLIKAATTYDSADAYMQHIEIPLDDIPKGRGPTAVAVREGRYDVCNDIAGDPRMTPWREAALAREFRSSAAFPLRVGSGVVGALSVYAKKAGFFTIDEITLLESLADNISFALEFLTRDAKRRLVEEVLRESEERLRHLTSQLLQAQEKERRYLSLELHDDLGQSLMVLKMQLRVIEKTVPPDQWRTREECAHCLTYLNGVIDNVRRLARNLRPSALDDMGLTPGLRVLAEEFRKYHEVELSLETDDIEGLFSRDEEINIYRIFQEILTNIAKHALAKQVSIVIRRRTDGVTFQVTDNGVGFDLDQALVRDAAKKGLGLAALEERVRILGGTLTIMSQEHLGTEISFMVPSTGKQ